MRRETFMASTHGERHVELTLSYPLAEGARSRDDSYRLDLYLFTPYQLGVTRARFPVAAFFGDLVSYTRLRTPHIELERVVDPRSEASPLNRVRRRLAERDAAAALDADGVAYELRMLVNVYRSQTRDRRHAIRDALRQRALPPEDVETACRRLLADMDAVLAGLRGLEPLFLNAGMPDGLRESFRWADELSSIRTEKNLVRLHRDLDAAGLLAELREELRRRIAAEGDHRRARGFESVVDPTDPRRNELVVYRDGLLKKWSESCLYMTIAPSRSVNRVLNLLFGVAAALAMAFAVLAAVLAAQWFPEGSMSWALLLVVAYAFKDRIKDGLRALFLRALPRLVADRVQHLVDPATGQRVGRSRERVSSPAPTEVPLAVRRLRYGRPDPLRALLPPEDVLHYQKDIRVAGRDLRSSHGRTDALVEILRLDLRAWQLRMDDPENRVSRVEGDTLRDLRADRVYHVNAVASLTGAHDDPAAGPSLHRYRIVLTSRGILRIEPVP